MSHFINPEAQPRNGARHCSLLRGRFGFIILASGAMRLSTVLAGTVLAASGASGTIEFSRDIQPIFSENCYACHGPDKDKRKAGLRLDLKEGPFQKLESGAFALVPGKPAQSKLLQLVTLPLNDDDHMPPKKT